MAGAAYGNMPDRFADLDSGFRGRGAGCFAPFQLGCRCRDAGARRSCLRADGGRIRFGLRRHGQGAGDGNHANPATVFSYSHPNDAKMNDGFDYRDLS